MPSASVVTSCWTASALVTERSSEHLQFSLTNDSNTMDLAPSAVLALSGDAKKAAANECVFEIRYRPNARVLDSRGDWAEELSRSMELPQWSIIENRVDLFTTDQSRRAFVSFRNAGFQAIDVPTRDYFPDQATKLMRTLLTFDTFGDRILVERIGVRQRFATPYDGTFDDLASRFASRYVSVTESARKAIGEDSVLVDVGAPLNFRDRLGEFHTVAGPMRSEEFPKFFTKNESFPDVGLYFDIDYFRQPKAAFGEREIATFVTASFRSGWERHERVLALILG